MAIKNVIPSGNLDMENDIHLVKNGDYRDAVDVTPISDAGGNTIAWEADTGNLRLPSLPLSPATGKIVEIWLATGNGSYTFSLRRPNLTTSGIIIGNNITINQALTVAGTVSNAIAAIQAQIPQAVVTDVSTATQPRIRIELVFTGLQAYLNGWDWKIRQANTFGNIPFDNQITIREANKGGSKGYVKAGSYDLLGDLWVISTDTEEKPRTINVQNWSQVTVPNVGGRILVFAPNHGLKQGDIIYINGFTFTNNILGVSDSFDGEWCVEEVINSIGLRDPFYFYLATSAYAPITQINLNPTITINPYSSTQIGVYTFDDFNQTYNYTSLLTSRAFGITLETQPEMVMEKNVFRTSLYFVNGVSYDRALYYYGTYIPNGFLSSSIIPNSLGIYDYDTINDESKLSVNNLDIRINYVSVVDGSGDLPSGNIRYAVRFLTESLNSTEWSNLSDIVSIYSTSFTRPREVFGDADGTTCKKIVTMSVSNIPVGVFKYIECAYVSYTDTAKSSFLFKREILSSNVFTFQHTGYEPKEAVDLGTLNIDYAYYDTSKSISILDNRLIRSNLSTPKLNDLSSFFSSWQHTLKRKTIQAAVRSQSQPYDTMIIGEYADPNNVYNNKSFRLYETYRLGAKVKLKGGDILQNVFWIDDIRIDTDPTNLASQVNRRTANGGLPDFNIVNGSGNPYVYYITFSNINWDFIVDGRPVYDIIDTVYLQMVEMSDQYKEVYGSGIITLGVDASQGTINGGRRYELSGNGFPVGNFGTLYGGRDNSGTSLQDVWEWNLYGGNPQLLPFGFGQINQYVLGDGRKFASLYFPDLIYGDFAPVANDEILFFDNLTSSIINQGTQGFNGGVMFQSQYVTLTPNNTNANAQILRRATIEESKFITTGSFAKFDIPNKFFSKEFTFDITDTSGNQYNATSSPSSRWYTNESWVVYSNSNAGDGFMTGGTPLSFLLPKYAFYYRSKGMGAKFGPTNTSRYVSASAIIDSRSSSSIDVYGDCFTQGTIAKIRGPVSNTTPYNNSNNAFWKYGWGLGIQFYSQNRVNSQMKYDQGGNNANYPGLINSVPWLEGSGVTAFGDYSNSYTDRDEVGPIPAYDPNILTAYNYPTRIAYSEKSQNGSPVDNYRTFLALNFKDLDLTNGEIVHHAVGNGELMTWQERAFERQYFNTNGLLQSKDGSEVVIGDGGALTRRGLRISSIGTKHKWSVIKGRSKGGNDVFAWWNTDLGIICRFGYDGTVPISIVQNMNYYIKNNTKWAKSYYTPARDMGIHGVWDDRHQKFIWTVRGRKQNHYFNPLKYYQTGDWVAVPQNNGQFYDVYSVITNTLKLESVGNFQDYKVIDDLTDQTYFLKADLQDIRDNLYDEITISFNELKNGFQCRDHTFKPTIYSAWRGTFVSANPVVRNENYIHGLQSGNDFFYRLFPGNPYIQLIFNDAPMNMKDYIAIRLNSDMLDNARINSNSTRIIDLNTEQHTSYLDLIDFEKDELDDIMRSSPIKNESLTTGSNNDDTSSLFGKYLLMKYNFSLGYALSSFNFREKFTGLVLKYLERNRSNNS